MTPEEKARREIDRQLGLCGWIVQDRQDMNISAGPGVAIREFPLLVGEADYLLYVDCKAAGIIEAKPEGYTLTGVELQSAKYVSALPAGVPSHRLPLPVAIWMRARGRLSARDCSRLRTASSWTRQSRGSSSGGGASVGRGPGRPARPAGAAPRAGERGTPPGCARQAPGHL